MHTPKVTVLMSVYNGESFLREAIESILNQTYKEFEFLIINDCSTDGSLKIIKSYNDSRINIIENKENIGLTKSLNKGLELAKGEYIARMDADDICLPHRLDIQVSFMDSNKEIGICGSWIQILGTTTILKFPKENEAIKVHMFETNALAHPTVIIRNSFFKTFSLHYDATFRCAQDYELWSRAYIHFKLANIQEVLVSYRSHINQITQLNATQQKKNRDHTILNQLKYLNVEPTDNEFKLHKAILSRESLPSVELVQQSELWLDKIESANEKIKLYDDILFVQMIENLRIATKRNYFIQEKYTFGLLKGFFNPSIKIYKFFNLKEQVIFSIKCLLCWTVKNKNAIITN